MKTGKTSREVFTLSTKHKHMHESFADVIFRMRRSQRLLQKTVAMEAAIAPSYLTKLERGHGDLPGRKVVLRLAAALGADEQETDLLLRKAAAEKVERLLSRTPDDFLEAGQFKKIVRTLGRLEPEQIAHIGAYVELIDSWGKPQRGGNKAPTIR